MKNDIQKFNNYKKVQESFEEVEELINVTEDDNELVDFDNDGDLDSPEEIEAGITDVSDVAPTTPEVGLSGCNIFIINASEDDEEIDGLTETLKKDCSCKEIHLYQLNIKDSNSEKEPKDGMEFIYNELEGSDAIIFASNEMNDSLKTCLKRMKNHYSEGELKNKIFGAIIDTEKGSLKEDLTNSALNDFQMIVSGDCICSTSDKTANDITNLSVCVKELCEATSNLRQSDSNVPEEVDQEIRTYGEFIDEKQVEDPYDSTLEDDLPEQGTEEHDEFIDELKGDVSKELALPEVVEEEEEEKKDKDKEKDKEKEFNKDNGIAPSGKVLSKGVPTSGVHKIVKNADGTKTKYDVNGNVVTEEEERLIDNLDGTITDINKGWEDTNKPKGNPQKWEDKKVDEEEETVVEEEETIEQQALPFSKFNSTSWKKYQESKNESTVNEYHYDEWSKVTEDEEEFELEEEEDVPNKSIDHMNAEEIKDMLTREDSISIPEIERAMARMKQLEGTPEYDSKKAGFEHPYDNVHGEYEEEIVEEEDVPNMELDLMPYDELLDTIEKEDSLSIAEVERAMNRSKEPVLEHEEEIDDILDFDEFGSVDAGATPEQSYTMPEPGQRVRMIEMGGDPDAINPGEEGVVDHIDGASQIHMKWDNGRTLAIIPGVDKFEII